MILFSMSPCHHDANSRDCRALPKLLGGQNRSVRLSDSGGTHTTHLAITLTDHHSTTTRSDACFAAVKASDLKAKDRRCWD
ncbi:hypothetical protein E2C01_075425 [Portunus trituberculatus]|uniref:Uncharacterized protein n=1 Tax=Portunus trituberculatus TaxID=210409 RepID=A0A5B7IAN5_PORTR|nr:hypothetical protein [Portunus trituberculatus]